jgi:hypothetical protein
VCRQQTILQTVTSNHSSTISEVLLFTALTMPSAALHFLCFPCQVYNKWQDDSDSLVASGALPLQQVLQLSQVDHPATAEAGPCSHTFLVPLQLLQGSGEAAVQQQGVAVLLQVTVSYFAENCYNLEEDETLLQQQEGQQQQQAVQRPSAAVSPTTVARAADHAQQAASSKAVAGLAAALLAASALSPVAAWAVRQEQPGPNEDVGRQAVAAADHWQEAAAGGAANPAADCSMPPASDTDGSSSSSSSEDSDSELEGVVSTVRPGSSAAADAAAAAAAGAGAAAEPAADAVSAEVVPAQPQLLQAALCVEVVRACGLQVSLT